MRQHCALALHPGSPGPEIQQGISLTLTHHSFTMGDDAKASASAWRAALVGAVGNLSVQYNLQAASIALAIIKTSMPPPSWVKYSLLGAVFAGALVGMTCMGYLGDIVGRRRAMLGTLSLVVLGALVTALGAWGDSLYLVICLARFIIGVGVGGIYPLAAATTAESKSQDSGDPAEDAAALVRRVGWAFFWQTPGAMMPYVVASMLLGLPSDTPALESVQLRLVLGLGALPAAFVWVATYMSEESEAFTSSAAAAAEGLSEKEENHSKHIRTLAGTGLTWLLFDVAFYGTNIFTPQILSAIFGPSETLGELCWQSLVVQSMGLPATIVTIWLMAKYSGRSLNMWGFALMAISFAGMALLFGAYPSSGDASPAKFALFALITFSINFGPNVVTYVLPAQLFPTQVRSRYHGASAASGKVGAVIGSFMYTPIANSGQDGLADVMWVQVALCLVGVGVAYILLPHQAEVETPAGYAEAAEEADDGLLKSAF